MSVLKTNNPLSDYQEILPILPKGKHASLCGFCARYIPRGQSVWVNRQSRANYVLYCSKSCVMEDDLEYPD